MGKKKKPKANKNTKKAQKAQEKARDKKKQKVAKDMTFGLKNKKKSKRVQKFIKGVEHSVKNRKKLSDRERKKVQKLEERERQRELAKYFGNSSYTKEKKGGSGGGTLTELDTEIEDQKEMTIEEIIETERAKIIDGTPVTEESFKKWKEFRKKIARGKGRREEKFRSMVSGKDLFTSNGSVFVDDDEALGGDSLKIDDSLFLDDFDDVGGDVEEEEEEEDIMKETIEDYLGKFTPQSEYVPLMWNAVCKKNPKSMLFDKLKEESAKPPIYLVANISKEGYTIKCMFKYGGEDQSIVGEVPVKKKKNAEHYTAILALKKIYEIIEKGVK